MHQEPMHFIYETKCLYPNLFYKKRWLDIGSVNGTPHPSSHVRKCEWVGVDLEDGLLYEPKYNYHKENYYTNWVGRGHDYRSKERFDVVSAFEVFEHDPFYDLTIANMINHLKPHGMFIMTCAGLGRVEHGTSKAHPSASPFTAKIDGWDSFYQNRAPIDFKSIPHWDRLQRGYWGINEATQDLYYRGWKSDIKEYNI
tara:strand:+ start:715 stop:1308 length:594 start_codon:yes stop_codon:yes gene_type:complete